jgi:hypothetical protein
MRTMLGTLCLAVSTAICGLLLATEMQYWTKQDFIAIKAAKNYNALAPQAKLDHLAGGWSTVLIAVVAAFAAIVLLIGRGRLLILGGVWLFMGLAFAGHFHAPGQAMWAWAAGIALGAFIVPLFFEKRFRRVTAVPKGQAVAW